MTSVALLAVPAVVGARLAGVDLLARALADVVDEEARVPVGVRVDREAERVAQAPGAGLLAACLARRDGAAR